MFGSAAISVIRTDWFISNCDYSAVDGTVWPCRGFDCCDLLPVTTSVVVINVRVNWIYFHWPAHYHELSVDLVIVLHSSANCSHQLDHRGLLVQFFASIGLFPLVFLCWIDYWMCYQKLVVLTWIAPDQMTFNQTKLTNETPLNRKCPIGNEQHLNNVFFLIWNMLKDWQKLPPLNFIAFNEGYRRPVINWRLSAANHLRNNNNNNSKGWIY